MRRSRTAWASGSSSGNWRTSSFRFLEPELYKKIAQMLDEKRVERERYIADGDGGSARELASDGIHAEVTGRPEAHLQHLQQDASARAGLLRAHDVRALRVLVDEVKDCYTALGVVHNLWQPIPSEFDDYISLPKATTIARCTPR